MTKVKFKSLDWIFHKEKCGLKPNTVRKIDLMDDRFLSLISKAYNGFNEAEVYITIENAQTREEFEREVDDITIFNDLMIISWKHDTNQAKSEKGDKE